MALAVTLAGASLLSACADDDDSGNADGGAAGSGASAAASGESGSAGSAGATASAGGASNTGGSKSTGGTAGGTTSGAGGSGGDDSSGGTDSNGGAGGRAAEGCIEGLEGTWKIPGYEAYLRIDDACQVTMFCDLVKDYHSTGYFEGNTITLIDVATTDVTLEGDTLTLLMPSESTDTIVFVRQESEDVIPAACLE